MNADLNGRLRNDILSNINESLMKFPDLADGEIQADGVVDHLDEFIGAYGESQIDNPDAKGLTLTIGIRLYPSSDQVKNDITCRWTAATKYKSTFGTPIDVEPLGERAGDLPDWADGDDEPDETPEPAPARKPAKKKAK